MSLKAIFNKADLEGFDWFKYDKDSKFYAIIVILQKGIMANAHIISINNNNYATNRYKSRNL